MVGGPAGCQGPGTRMSQGRYSPRCPWEVTTRGLPSLTEPWGSENHSALVSQSEGDPILDPRA